MSAKMRMVLTVPTSNQTMIDRMRIMATSPRFSFNRIASYLMAIAGGPYAGSMVTASGAVQASGTVTFSSIADADTVTIGATVFTGSETPTGAQFQTNATPSAAADKVAAASLAAVINANTTTNKLVTASNVAGTAVVTITCQVPGLIGNFFPIAISAHGSVSGTGKLTSGAEDANITISNGF